MSHRLSHLNAFSDEDDEPYEFRLPEEIRPIHYDLQLEFDSQQVKFNGLVTIHFKVLAPISYVALHAKGLNIHTEAVLRLDRVNRRGCDDFHSFPFKKFDYWIILFQEKLKEGEYHTRLRYSGRLSSEQQIGIFTAKYSNDVEDDGNRMIIATRFMPTFARLAFPCMDEPEMKATFSITLIYPDEEGLLAISNMQIKEQKTLQPNKVEVEFATTPPMSTYMLGFMIANMSQKTVTMPSGLELRIFVEDQNAQRTEYAKLLASAFLEYFGSYFDQAYPLPKLDLVALPQLKVGFVEQWGLLFFDDSLLLFHPKFNTSGNTQHIAMLTAHALFRMWLGCLVTLTWWDQLWLAKGLATYMEYKSVHKIRSDWGVMDQFLILEMYPAMTIDASCMHPLAIEIGSERQIPAAFDKISCMKSAALMRMLEQLVGAERLRSESAKYVAKYAYKNAAAMDFLNVLQTSVPDVPILKILQSFTEKNGFPYILVTRTSDSNVFRLSQQRFLVDPEDYKRKLRSSKDFYTWTIPVTYVTSNDAEVKQLIFNQQDWHMTLSLEHEMPILWIKLNKNAEGYYRVNYSSELWEQLTTALYTEPQQFSVTDRAQLISDCFAFANACQLSYAVPLELTAYLSGETAFVPWYVVVAELKETLKLLNGTDIYNEFQEFTQNLLLPIYRNISWSKVLSHVPSLLRICILDAACAFKLKDALTSVIELFRAWIHDPDFEILLDLKGIVLSYGMEQVGNPEIWELVWDRFMLEENALERRRLLRCLAAVKSQGLLSHLVELAMKADNISDEEFFKCIFYISCNMRGRGLVWNYVRKFWTELLERFGRTNFDLSNLIPQITAEFKTKTRLDELQNFIDENRGKGMSTCARDEAVNKIACNIHWLSQNEGTIRRWLRSEMHEDSFHSAEDIFRYSGASEASTV